MKWLKCQPALLYGPITHLYSFCQTRRNAWVKRAALLICVPFCTGHMSVIMEIGPPILIMGADGDLFDR